MATVRFSDTLKSEIMSNANRVYQPMLEKARQNYPKERWSTQIYEAAFSAHQRSLMAQLPETYFKKHESVECTCPRDFDVKGLHGVVGHSFTLDFTGLSFPYDDNASPVLQFSWRNARLNDSSMLPQFREEYVQFCKGIAEVEQQREAFVDGVKKVINAYSTLAPALKAWPALWDLVPDEAKDRHKKIVERKRGDTPDLDVDTNTLTAAVTMSKLTR